MLSERIMDSILNLQDYKMELIAKEGGNLAPNKIIIEVVISV